MINKSIFRIVALGFLLQSACGSKFDKSKWLQTGDIHSHPYRDKMLRDLLDNHKLVGLTRMQLEEMLGEPEKYSDTKPDEIYYEILTEWGGIDPVRVTNLVFKVDQTMHVGSFRVDDFRK